MATEKDRLSYITPISGFYFVKETKVLWCYEGGEWVSLTTPPKQQINFLTNYVDLPSVGEQNVLYIVGTREYIWDGLDYVRVGEPMWESL